MEFRLNKIDPDLRQQINEATSEGKVHSKNNISVNKEKNWDNKKNFLYKLEKYKNKKKLMVDAVKTENVEIEAFKEDSEGELSKGIFLNDKR